MARFGARWDDWEQGKEHKARVISKIERIQGLEALLQTWEGRDDADHEYILELRARLRKARNQYEAMA